MRTQYVIFFDKHVLWCGHASVLVMTVHHAVFFDKYVRRCGHASVHHAVSA